MKLWSDRNTRLEIFLGGKKNRDQRIIKTKVANIDKLRIRKKKLALKKLENI